MIVDLVMAPSIIPAVRTNRSPPAATRSSSSAHPPGYQYIAGVAPVHDLSTVICARAIHGVSLVWQSLGENVAHRSYNRDAKNAPNEAKVNLYLMRRRGRAAEIDRTKPK